VHLLTLLLLLVLWSWCARREILRGLAGRTSRLIGRDRRCRRRRRVGLTLLLPLRLSLVHRCADLQEIVQPKVTQMRTRRRRRHRSPARHATRAIRASTWRCLPYTWSLANGSRSHGSGASDRSVAGRSSQSERLNGGAPARPCLSSSGRANPSAGRRRDRTRTRRRSRKSNKRQIAEAAHVLQCP
jgi:hypothetical protein